MIHTSGTGDKSETTFYTVPALPSPGRYALRFEGAVANASGFAVGINIRVNGLLFSVGKELAGQGAAHDPPPNGRIMSDLSPTVQELLLADGDVLSYEIAIETAGIAHQTYTWQVDFRLCRMPEDLLA